MTFKKRSGFSLIETLVVVSISVFLSGLILVYNRSTENQIVLYRDQALVVSLLNRAKSLAAQKFFDPGSPDYVPCAFGLHFEPDSSSFSLFQDLGEGSCVNANSAYGPTPCLLPSCSPPPPEEMEVFTLHEKLTFVNIPEGGLDILYVSPELNVTTTFGGGFPVTILLQEIGGVTAPITVLSAGQISTN